eukprot:SAG31_NODE_498_length_14861_cov_3.405026_13_plen_54_part_00
MPCVGGSCFQRAQALLFYLIGDAAHQTGVTQIVVYVAHHMTLGRRTWELGSWR